MTAPQILDITSDALSLVPAAAAIWISLRVLRFPDLSIEYTVAFAAFMFMAVGRYQHNWLFGLAASIGAGAMVYLAMGLLIEYGKLPGILTALVAAYALYSLSLLILGSPNASVEDSLSVLPPTAAQSRLASATARLLLPAGAAILITGVNCWLLCTVGGQKIVAVGANRLAAERLGIPSGRLAVLGMIWAGALVGISGFLTAQSGGYVDIGMGTGLLAVFLISISLARAGTALLASSLQGAKRLQVEVLILSLAVISTRFLVSFALQFSTSPAAVRLVIAVELLVIAALLRKHVADLLRGLRL